LTIIVFGSILVGKPFTEPYARQHAPPKVWHSETVPPTEPADIADVGLGFLGRYGLVGARRQYLRNPSDPAAADRSVWCPRRCLQLHPNASGRGVAYAAGEETSWAAPARGERPMGYAGREPIIPAANCVRRSQERNGGRRQTSPVDRRSGSPVIPGVWSDRPRRTFPGHTPRASGGSTG
jgi:hypothetical protein